MNNFIFYNPTKLIFGKDTIANLSDEIPKEKRILITFGGGSVKSNGVYNQVKEALKAHNSVEFWGIEPNPTVETLREAINVGKENRCDFTAQYHTTLTLIRHIGNIIAKPPHHRVHC